MGTTAGNRLPLAIQFILMTSSVFAILCVAEESLPCPEPCECFQEKYDPFGQVNTIVCTNLGLRAVPDLTPLLNSPIKNNLLLDRNEIAEIHKDNFPAGLNIVALDLNQNLRVKIADNAFLNLGISLRKMSLQAVDIVFDKTLAFFDSLFSLEELSLNNNNKHPYTVGAVQNVTATLFQGEVVKHLKKLELAFCGIRTMTDNTLANLVRLQELDLSNNWFVSVPPAIKLLTNLEFVEFFYCNIQELKNNDFSGLSRLQRLDLSANSKLARIEDKAFSGCEDSLAKLNIQRCNLRQVPTKALQNLKHLSFLDISENNFTDIQPGAFAGKYKLKDLAISSPQLTFSPDMFQGQEANIAELSIPRMNLKIVPLAPLRKLTNLRRLSMTHNAITSLPARAFAGITATSILLDDNPLAAIAPAAFDGLDPQLVVSLRRTRVSDLDFLLGYSDDAIDSVNFEHSRLVCRCAMKSAINVTQNIHIYGSCYRGNKSVHIDSYKLEGILDQACEDEKRGNSGNIFLPTLFILIVSLILTCT